MRTASRTIDDRPRITHAARVRDLRRLDGIGPELLLGDDDVDAAQPCMWRRHR
jgi:hypothetical protein